MCSDRGLRTLVKPELPPAPDPVHLSSADLGGARVGPVMLDVRRRPEVNRH